MAKLALIATVEAAPGRKHQLVASLMAHRARCLKDERGTLQMEVLTPREDVMKLLLCEVYREDGAFDVQRNGPSFAEWHERAPERSLSFP
jgi:quinol monooxygenase YgiN